jgi:hypothetical protein
MQAVLDKYGSIGDDGTSVVTEAVRTACNNQIDLARKHMLSGKSSPLANMTLARMFADS